jgi:tetratricopeptide (TPR) repeat protein/transcriptional regulator with XRE-family HTH domain
VAEQAGLSFGGLLRRLRDDAGLTQDELAEAAGVSQRAVSDLERGINRTARKDTAVLLADALGLGGRASELFISAARGRAPAGEALAAVARQTQAGAAAASRTLPRDIASFTGRQGELGQLMAQWAEAAGRGGVVSVHAIGGMAGVGKTTFAVHAAHRLAAGFPDGQFFVPLHAHTPGQRPVGPADALASLLLTAGVPASQIPPGTDARAGRWRDHVAGKRILLLLDDAASHEQVRPLLPGTPGNLVLITSRRRLAALEDAAVLSLDTLAPGEAAVLLARLAGRPGLAAADPGVGEITALCGCLPLAIAMIGRQLAHHPAWTAAGLAGELAAAAGRLELMAAENLSVAAAFDLSYQDLDGAGRRLFRRLGLHPGPDIDAHAAAALDDTTPGQASRHLEDLYDQHLITQPAPGRYHLHDLLREHARALAAADPADTAAAAGRLLDYYLHTALDAGRHIAARTMASGRPPPGKPPACTPQLSSPELAAAWLETERPNLHAAAGYAAACGRPLHAIAIPAAIGGFLRAHAHWDQSAALHQTALTAARHAGLRSAQADILDELGNLSLQAGDYPAATASYEQALALYDGSGDRSGQAHALIHLGLAQDLTGNHTAAVGSHQQALALFRDLGDRSGQAFALSDLGAAQAQAGDCPPAADNLTQALALFRDLGNPYGQAGALDQLGVVQRLTGDHTAAAASHQHALALYRDVGDRVGQAEALNNLGQLLSSSSASQRARDYHTQALAIARDISAPLEEARALEGIGLCHLQDGDPGQGTPYLREALTTYQRIGAPGAQRVQQALHPFRQESRSEP